MIANIVDEMVAEHGGGEAYFDGLDARLRTREVFTALMSMSYALFGPRAIVTSGSFGRAYQEQYGNPSLIVLPGGVRHDPLVMADAVVPARGRKYVFMDDSFYQGRTYRATCEAIARNGGKVVGAVVAYDGAPAWTPFVYSLYRWRDRR